MAGLSAAAGAGIQHVRAGGRAGQQGGQLGRLVLNLEAAVGKAGQPVYGTAEFPDRDAVVVFTAGNYSSADTTIKIIAKHLVPAFE